MTATKKSSTSSMRAAAVASSEEHYASSRKLETFQDLLIKLGIKPLMPVLEISMFSLNNVIVRLTKIMNRADKNWALS